MTSLTVLNKHPATLSIKATLSLSSEDRHGTGGKVAEEAGGDNKVADQPEQAGVAEEEDASSA